MDYEIMSDGELNLRLWRLVAAMPDGYATICLPDYCNDWSATMPLAIKHDISMLSCDGVYEVSYDYEAPVGKFGTDETLTWHIDAQKDQTLRAIVICLIKVLEAKRCN